MGANWNTTVFQASSSSIFLILIQLIKRSCAWTTTAQNFMVKLFSWIITYKPCDMQLKLATLIPAEVAIKPCLFQYRYSSSSQDELGILQLELIIQTSSETQQSSNENISNSLSLYVQLKWCNKQVRDAKKNAAYEMINNKWLHAVTRSQTLVAKLANHHRVLLF